MPAGGLGSPSAAVEAVLDRHGVFDRSRRQRVRREAQRRLEERATKQVVRVLIQEALGQGWGAPPRSVDAFEPPQDFPVPVRQAVYNRVLRWIRERPDFSARDLQRASNWFETAGDVRAVVDGLVAQGEVEVLPAPLRWPGERGRPPGTRYRAVRGMPASVNAPASRVSSDFADVDDLDWSSLGPDET